MNPASIPQPYTRRALELRAAAYYASIRKPKSEWKTLEDLAPQLAEFEHYICAGDFGVAYSLLELIDNILRSWGYYIQLTEMRKQLLDHLIDSRLRASNLCSLGSLCLTIGQFEESIDLYEQALTIIQELENLQEESRILGGLGGAYRNLGMVSKAIQFYRQSLEINRKIEDRYGEEWILSALGSVYRTMGRIEQAIQFHSEALRIAYEIDDYIGIAARLDQLGSAYSNLGKMERAVDFYQQSLDISRKTNHSLGEEIRLGNLALIYFVLGESQKAIGLCKKALNIARRINDRRGEGIRLSSLGYFSLNLGDVEQAIQLYEQALLIAREIGSPSDESFALMGLTKALLFGGKIEEANKTLCAKISNTDITETRYKMAITLGILLLHQSKSGARQAFLDAINQCDSLLNTTSKLYQPCYALSIAQVGQAVCDPNWSNPVQRTILLTPALTEYHHALAITSAPGVVRDALRDLELIRAAGIEGLEPVFALLEGALADWKPPEDAVCPSSLTLQEDTL